MADPEIVVRGRSDLSDIERGLSRSSSSLAKWGKRAAFVTGAAVVATGVAVAKLGAVSVRAASEAEQSLGATETVFGKYAKGVIRNSDRAARAVGLSANEYRESSNLIGALFKNQGVASDKLAGKTRNMVRLGADLAATFGGPTSDAVEALGSAFKGEFDPLERYGISIKQSAVNTEALGVAGVKTETAFKKLSTATQTAAKQTATMNLLSKQGAQASGAFAKESNTLAGQQQRLAAQGENLLATIGTGLTPALTDLARVAGRDVLPPLQDLAEEYAPKLGAAISDLSEKAGPVLQSALRRLPDLFDELKDPETGKNVDTLAASFSDLRPVASSLVDTLPAFNDLLSVSSTVLGFAADNSDKLAKALPFLAAGYVAVKAAQLGANAARALALPAKIAEIAVNRQLVSSNRALIASRSADTAALRTNTTAQTTNTTAAATGARTMGRLGIAARGAAGVGGLGALAVGASTSNDALGTLASVGGGAMLGFGLAGPVGLAIGAGAGLLQSLASRTDESAASFREAREPAVTFADSLDQVTGAATRSTRELIRLRLEQLGALEPARQLGVSQRDLVGFISGNADAIGRVNRAIRSNSGETRTYVDANGQFRVAMSDSTKNAAALAQMLGVTRGELRGEIRAAREAALSTQRLADVYKGVPRRVVTDIRARGGELSRKEIRQLRREYELTPKQVRTLFRVNGMKPALRDLTVVGTRIAKLDDSRVTLRGVTGGVSRAASEASRSASRAAKDVDSSVRSVDRLRAEMRPFRSSVSSGVDDARDKARKGAQDIASGLLDGTARARSNLSPFTGSLSSQISSARGVASSGGSGIGSALGAGVSSGIGAWVGTIATKAAGLVRSAIAAARSAANINSPSKETEYVGRMMGRGLAVGLDAERARARRAGRSLVGKALEGVGGGLDKIRAALDRVNGLVDKYGKKHAKTIKKSLRDEFRQLVKNGQQQDRNTRKLDKALEKQKQLVATSKQYAATIKASVVEYGSVVGLGANEDGSVSLTSVLTQLQDRVVAAERYADLIKTLQGAGLNRTTVKQLLAAGVEGGLATAEALVTGGAAAVDKVNILTSQIAKAGGGLGSKMSREFYGAGIQAANGLVRGLTRQQNKLDRAANRLANQLAKQVRKRLGISSPSRVFDGIGQNVGRGLVNGLRVQETHVRRTAADVAASTVKGYGSPVLPTPVPVAGGRGGGGTVRIHLTSDQVSQLQRGKQIIADVAAAQSAGHHRPATGVR